MTPTKFVKIVTVIDPDTNLPVELEIRKLENGLMVGLDCSYLENCGPYDTCSPYNAEEYDRPKWLIIPDNEEHNANS